MAEGSFSGKAAIITGGARGIGLAIAKTLAGGGADIAIWDVIEEGAKASAKEIQGLGVKAVALKVDVTNAAEVDRAASETVEALGKASILVNNAGITRDGMFLRMDESDWDLVLAINLKGAFLCTKAVARKMRKTGGSIVNMASVVGITGNVGQANYSASKAGLIGLTKTCARELARYGIRVNAVAPGYIDTEMTRGLSEDVREQVLASVPLGRYGTPEEVASVVSFLAGDGSSYLTGQAVHVCGGMAM
jgi:3-oxoacyl-[acyl-carrier protein] reductase